VSNWKFAVTACGEVMGTVVDVLEGAATGPVQLVNWYPALALALIGAAAAAS
jgi:hypothetical protein